MSAPTTLRGYHVIENKDWHVEFSRHGEGLQKVLVKRLIEAYVGELPDGTFGQAVLKTEAWMDCTDTRYSMIVASVWKDGWVPAREAPISTFWDEEIPPSFRGWLGWVIRNNAARFTSQSDERAASQSDERAARLEEAFQDTRKIGWEIACPAFLEALGKARREESGDDA